MTEKQLKWYAWDPKNNHRMPLYQGDTWNTNDGLLLANGNGLLFQLGNKSLDVKVNGHIIPMDLLDWQIYLTSSTLLEMDGVHKTMLQVHKCINTHLFEHQFLRWLKVIRKNLRDLHPNHRLTELSLGPTNDFYHSLFITVPKHFDLGTGTHVQAFDRFLRGNDGFALMHSVVRVEPVSLDEHPDYETYQVHVVLMGDFELSRVLNFTPKDDSLTPGWYVVDSEGTSYPIGTEARKLSYITTKLINGNPTFALSNGVEETALPPNADLTYIAYATQPNDVVRICTANQVLSEVTWVDTREIDDGFELKDGDNVVISHTSKEAVTNITTYSFIKIE